jgi:DeoR/GlpR family transcriptional regulator of sugar metabolism
MHEKLHVLTEYFSFLTDFSHILVAIFHFLCHIPSNGRDFMCGGSGIVVTTEERRTRLLELVRQRGFAALPDLVDVLQVSESTIRRDLDFLEDSGSARRTHGGVFYTGHAPVLPHFDERQPSNWEQKRAIAAKAAELVEIGDSVLLDGGTTTYEVARLLVGRSLQVVTNSLPVANLFASSRHTELVLLGGYIDPRSGVALGPYATEMLGHLNVRKTILSVGGIHDRGYFNSNLLLVETERAMMQAGDRVIVVADSTKFGRRSLQLLGPLDEADQLVVDDGIAPEWIKRVEQAGVDLVVAELRTPKVEDGNSKLNVPTSVEGTTAK